MFARGIERLEREKQIARRDVGFAVDHKIVHRLEILKRLLRCNAEISVHQRIVIPELVQSFLESADVLPRVSEFKHVFLCDRRIQKLKQILVRYAGLIEIMRALEQLDRIRDGLIVNIAGLVRSHVKQLHEPCLDVDDFIVDVADLKYLPVKIGRLSRRGRYARRRTRRRNGVRR